MVKSTFVGEWKQDFPRSGGCGNIGEGVHEHGEWEVASRGQGKVLRLIRIRGLRIKRGGSWSLLGVGPKSKQTHGIFFAKAKEQDIDKKRLFWELQIKGGVFIWVSTEGSKVGNRKR
jgi:hypothetical protein